MTQTPHSATLHSVACYQALEFFEQAITTDE